MFIRPQDLIAARQKAHLHPWAEFAQDLADVADAMLDPGCIDEEAAIPRNLFWARAFSRVVITLSGQYVYSQDVRYAQAAWQHVLRLFDRTHWCAEPSVNEYGDPVELDLATGEIGFTLANVITLLGDWLNADQRAALCAHCDARLFTPYLALMDTDDQKRWPWWYRCQMNWNSVSNGGLLCLALTLQDQLDSAKRCIPLMLDALGEFDKALHNDGSSEEGIGYWLYGHLYFLYTAISYENATGKTYPALDSQAMRNALDFPFDFSPAKVSGLSFNDVNFFNPTGGLYAMCNRTGNHQKVHALTERILAARAEYDKPQVFVRENCYMWPHEVFALALCQDEYAPDLVDYARPKLVIYPDNGWGLLNANNTAYLSLRSGDSRVNHGCRDLNAIAISKNGVLLVANCANHPYPDGWFGPTRQLYFEDSSAAKSTQLVNGIGQTGYGLAAWTAAGAQVQSQQPLPEDADGVWMESDATAMYPNFMQRVTRRAALCGPGFQLTDHFVIKPEFECVRPEIRFYTAGNILQMDDNTWQFEADGQTLTLQFAAEGSPLDFVVTQSVPSQPHFEALNMLRVFTPEPVHEVTLYTTLV